MPIIKISKFKRKISNLNIKDKRGRTCYNLLSSANEQVIKDICDAKEDKIKEYMTKNETYNRDLNSYKDQIEALKNDKKNALGSLDEFFSLFLFFSCKKFNTSFPQI